MAKFDLSWEGYLVWQTGLPTLKGEPHLACKRDQIKMRDYMDKRVTPPKWVTIPTWGPPPPCKQALKVSPAPFLQFQQLNHSPFIIWVNLVPLESHFYDLKSCYYFWTWVLHSTANDPETANDPRPQVIPKVNSKWSRKKNRNDLDSS